MVRRIALGAALALALPAAVALAQEAPYLITGGGQVIASSSDAGPGDTIAFVARQTGEETAQGELQVVNTSQAGGGQGPSLIFHGAVTCIRPGDGAARFGGIQRRGSQRFVVDVTDNGDNGNDMILFRFTDEEDPCDDSGSGSMLNSTTLSRGNVKVDTANSGEE